MVGRGVAIGGRAIESAEAGVLRAAEDDMPGQTGPDTHFSTLLHEEPGTSAGTAAQLNKVSD